MEKTDFKVSAEVLQRNAMKASIRDLNAEFQMKGGKVIYKTSKKGDVYLLSHPDEEYLEKFRVRLLKELGLLEDKDVPPEEQEKKAPPPRYGEDYKLRRGWNVRSPKEFSEGRYNKDDRMRPEGRPEVERRDGWRGGDRGDHSRRPHRDDRGFKGPRRGDPRRGPGTGDHFGHPQRRIPDKYDHRGQEEDDDLDNSRSFEERWGDVSEYLDIVREALEHGAVDDGEIIKYAYNRAIDKEKIKTLKKLLWDNRCKGSRNKCPHGKKKFRFEDLMKVVSGKVDGWENIDSPFIGFQELWKKNIEEMYGLLRDRTVEVRGKVSSFKPVSRKNQEHLKILVYDTMVRPEGGEERETRKLWVKIGKDEFEKLTSEKGLMINDVIRFSGKCVYDSYFHDHWVIDVDQLEVLERSDGEIVDFKKT